jgi:hypothetical protein
MKENTPDEKQEQPLLDLIQKIKDGQVDPKNLSYKTKLQCTELFRLESQTVYQIAQILKTSERQIKRYNKAIKKRNAITPDPNFTNQYIGNMIKKAEYIVDSLIRLSGGKEASNADKIKAKSAALHYMNALAKLLQSIAYIVSQPKKSEEGFQQKGLATPPIINILPVAPGSKKEPTKENKDA